MRARIGIGAITLRQRASSIDDPATMLGLGEAFFAELERAEAAGSPRPLIAPADPVAKSMARHGRRGGEHTEADETCVAAS